MNLILSKKALADAVFWKRSNPKISQRIIELIEDIQHTPYTGRGKPKPLVGNLAGYWSRRITGKDRLVYRVDESNDTIFIYALKGHYGH